MNVMKSAKRDQKAIWREFGPWLRRQREIAGKTRKQVAAEIDIHPVQLARIETGESGTRPDTLDLLIRCLNLDPKEAYKHAGFWPENESGAKGDAIDRAIDNALHFHNPSRRVSESDRAAIRSILERSRERAGNADRFIGIFIEQLIDIRAELAEIQARLNTRQQQEDKQRRGE